VAGATIVSRKDSAAVRIASNFAAGPPPPAATADRRRARALARFQPDGNPLEKAAAFALGLDFRILREGQVDEPPFGGRKRRQKLRPGRAFGLVRRAAGEVLERLFLLPPEPLGVEAGVHRPADAPARDAPGQHLEAVQALALVREKALDVVADQLEDHLVG